jgi:hypothetical protein
MSTYVKLEDDHHPIKTSSYDPPETTATTYATPSVHSHSTYDAPPSYTPHPIEPTAPDSHLVQSTEMQPVLQNGVFVFPMAQTYEVTNYAFDIARIPIHINSCTANVQLRGMGLVDPFVTYPELTRYCTREEYSASLQRLMNVRIPICWQLLRWFLLIGGIIFIISAFLLFFTAIVGAIMIFTFICTTYKMRRMSLDLLNKAAAYEQSYYAQSRQGRLPIRWYVDGNGHIVVSAMSQQ